MRGLYDLVFGYENADPKRPRFAAGLAAFLSGKMLFDYKGAIFWKMTAGMGDVVFAPMYEVLTQRGVQFEFFHRVDTLHVAPDGTTIDAISVGRQVALAPGRSRYDPLVRVGDLPCFPARPLVEQLDADGAVADQPLESHWCDWPDAEARVLRRGEDFDTVILGIPVGMAPRDLPRADRGPPRVARHGRPPGDGRDAVVSGLAARGRARTGLGPSRRHDQCLRAAVQHVGVDAAAHRRRAVGGGRTARHDRLLLRRARRGVARRLGGPAYARRYRERTRREAVQFLDGSVRQLLPGTSGPDGFRWDLLCGRDGAAGAGAFDTQHWVANVDPSDRYVLSLPGTDQYRLRSDESGYDNLFLAGDWTDSGLNAGCIESAVLSGLQAANAVHGRPRGHRIAGYYLP